MKHPRVGIIGGGASGLMAAITAAKNGAEVTILEHKDRIGKKILMTGNGKCNLTNQNIRPEFYYSQDLDYAMSILNQMTTKDIIDIFENLGLYTKEKKDGGVYPIAEQAAVVLDCLMQACDTYHIMVKTMVTITKISPGKEIMVSGTIKIPDAMPSQPRKQEQGNTKKNKKEKAPDITYHEKTYQQTFDQIIFACGSKAASVTGSDGSGYDYLKKLGYKLVPVVPALVQLHCEGDFFKGIAGVRVESAIKLYIEHKFIAEEYGELQITDYGISGIPVFQLSRLAAYGLAEGRKCEMEINLLPFPIFETKDAFASSISKDRSVIGWLEGFLNKKLALFMLKQHQMKPDDKLTLYTKKQLESIVYDLQHFKVKILKTNPFENAQVCAGGLPVTACNMDLSLKKYPNIYVVGELLDLDGKCGGYNLQWAWVTGILAGNAVNKCVKD